MYDVIIAGAGPAGSTCGRECAQQGLKTLLLDKDPFPRPKPCAGAVSEQTLSYLDFTLPPELIDQECFGARIHLNSRAVEIRKSERIAVLVSRDKFDSFLVKKSIAAGAQFLPEEKVTEVLLHHDSIEVRTGKSSHTARCLVGADGVHSIVAQRVRPAFTRDETAAALVCSVPAGAGSRDSRLNGFLDMYFGIAPMGYGWVFPHGEYYSVGIMGLSSEFPRPQKALEDFARSIGLPLAQPRGHVIPLGGIKRSIVKDRILLAGDAAGFADPFHGEGISYAVLSGKLAARAVAAAVKKDDFSALSRYHDECERLIRKNLRAALGMARLIDKFPGLAQRIFFDNTETLDEYLNIPAGKLDYHRFWRRLILKLPLSISSSCFRTIFRGS